MNDISSALEERVVFFCAIPMMRALASNITPRLNSIHRKRDTLSLSVSMAVGCGVSSCCLCARRCASRRRWTRAQKMPDDRLLLIALSSEPYRSSMDQITCLASHGKCENACTWEKRYQGIMVILSLPLLL